MRLLAKARLKAFGVLIGVGVAAFSAISIATLPTAAVVGVAITAVAVVVSKIGAPFDEAVCHSCGDSLAGERAGAYGVICPGCGALSEVSPMVLERTRQA